MSASAWNSGVGVDTMHKIAVETCVMQYCMVDLPDATMFSSYCQITVIHVYNLTKCILLVDLGNKNYCVSVDGHFHGLCIKCFLLTIRADCANYTRLQVEMNSRVGLWLASHSQVSST